MSDLFADVGVIGGSGFYSLLDDPQTVAVTTPWGEPSEPVTIGQLAGRSVAFVPRHGADHRFPPHRVPYRANLWALRSVGVRQVLAASAVGGLRADQQAGDIVVPDQILDRTWGRPHTYVDTDNGVAHVSFADPYCARGRAAVGRAADAGASGGSRVTGDGTLVVVNGPRFSSRAESHDFQRAGATIIGMTGMPEATLARELALCFTTIALITDLDAGVEVGHGVTMDEVFAAFAKNLPRLKSLLVAAIAELPSEQGDCPCGAVHGNTKPPFDLP